MLLGGNEAPTVQTAFKLSPTVSIFLSICSEGSSFGRSTTRISDSFMPVWKRGASSDTSHSNTPLSARVTSRSVTEFWSEWPNFNAEDKKTDDDTLRLHLHMHERIGGFAYIYRYARDGKNTFRWRLFWDVAIKFLLLEIPSHRVQGRLRREKEKDSGSRKAWFAFRLLG